LSQDEVPALDFSIDAEELQIGNPTETAFTIEGLFVFWVSDRWSDLKMDILLKPQEIISLKLADLSDAFSRKRDAPDPRQVAVVVLAEDGPYSVCLLNRQEDGRYAVRMESSTDVSKLIRTMPWYNGAYHK
jgi:hypothetical protein